MKDKVNTAMDRYELEAFKRENRLAENDYVFIRKMIDAFSRTREVNLIYIYGPSGAGKTFLLYSLFAALENAGNSNVLLYRMPDFSMNWSGRSSQVHIKNSRRDSIMQMQCYLMMWTSLSISQPRKRSSNEF